MKRSFRQTGFTLLELLTVITIILVLAAMIIHGMGYAQQKAARDRAVAEIAAISVALESYKADNGEYVKSDTTNGLIPVVLNPNNPDDPGTASPSDAAYKAASGYLAYCLCGQSAASGSSEKRYLELRPDNFSTGTVAIPIGDATLTVKYLIDPFGNSYGYSTAGVFNPTFDLWSYNGNPNPLPAPPPPEKPPKRWAAWSTNW